LALSNSNIRILNLSENNLNETVGD